MVIQYIVCALTYGAKKRSDSPHGLLIHLNHDHNESKDCITELTNSTSVPDNWSLHHQVKKQPQQQCGKAATFGRDFNLAVWQFWIRSPNLMYTNTAYNHVYYETS